MYLLFRASVNVPCTLFSSLECIIIPGATRTKNNICIECIQCMNFILKSQKCFFPSFGFFVDLVLLNSWINSTSTTLHPIYNNYCQKKKTKTNRNNQRQTMEIHFWIVLLSIYLNENNNNHIYDMTIESTFMFLLLLSVSFSRNAHINERQTIYKKKLQMRSVYNDRSTIGAA